MARTQDYLEKLREMLLGADGIDKEMVEAMIRTARGYAGGKGKQRKREQQMMYELCSVADGAPSRYFVEFAAAEPPATVNVLPKPGTYKHPQYGAIEITREGNTLFVDNFKNKVYQDKLPVDAEHETKLSGAVAWITALALNRDGSVEASVEWTERGEKLIEDDRFKYVSPEWYDAWKDPATGDEHANVLIGAALTTRPFFKDKALRPLVATEDGTLWDVDATERTPLRAFDLPSDTSVDDMQEAIRAAVLQTFPQLKSKEGYGPWLTAVYDEKVVVCRDTEYFEINYDLKDDGSVTFNGDPRLVQRVTRWLPRTASQPDAGDVHADKAKDYTPDERAALAKKKQALPDGSFPIANVADLTNAIQSIGRAADAAEAKAHITKRAKALGRTDLLPEDWPGSTKTKAKEASMELDTITKEQLDTAEGKGWLRKMAEAVGFKMSDPEPKPDPDKGEGDGDGEGEGSGDGAGNGDGDGEPSEGTRQMTEQLKSERQKREAIEKRLAAMEEQDRDRRYREIVLGRDEASVRQASEGDGTPLLPMVGDHAAKVSILKVLADARGEGSAEVKAFIANERAHAAQLKESGIYAEVGRDSNGAPATGDDPRREFDEKVKAAVEADKGDRPDVQKHADAIVKVAREHPELYTRQSDAVTSGRYRLTEGR